MDGEQGPGAPISGPNSGSSDDIPTYEELAADPEIAPLLTFEPVPRKVNVKGVWTPELQRELIARLAVHGAPNKVCEAMGKSRAGTDKLLRSPHGASFRAAWEGAVELAKRRKAEEAAKAEFVGPGFVASTLDRRRKFPPVPDGPRPGEVLNEDGEWEDEDSLRERAEYARDSISNKLLRARRMYLNEIASSPGKRAAFEILTELEIDWGRAERLEPQEDEPWRRINMREPDMLLTAENGWLGDIANATVPDKMASLRAALDRHYAERGLPAIDWKASKISPPLDGEG